MLGQHGYLNGPVPGKASFVRAIIPNVEGIVDIEVDGLEESVKQQCAGKINGLMEVLIQHSRKRSSTRINLGRSFFVVVKQG